MLIIHFGELFMLRPGSMLIVLAGAFTLLFADVETAQAQEVWDVTQARGETREIDFVTDEGTWMSMDVSPDAQSSSVTHCGASPQSQAP